MKTRNTLTTLLLVTAIYAEDAREIVLPIQGVTLYEDRALIGRSGEVSFDTGINQITIAGLPVSLQEPSLRASVGAESGARILSVSSRTEQKLETQDEHLRALEKADDELELPLETSIPDERHQRSGDIPEIVRAGHPSQPL